MNKIWEFAVSPKQVAVIAACLLFAGVFLSGAGVAAGILLAPRFRTLQAGAAITVPMVEKPSVAVTRPAVVAPVLPTPPSTAAIPESPAASAAKPAPLPIRLAVQVGSFSLEDAGDIVQRLKLLGYPAAAYAQNDGRGHGSVVQVGPYSAYDMASRTVLDLSGKYRVGPVIVPLTGL
ncbi:MAG: SPOR domain-containing protein [Acidobacteriota bacterium]|nr:SPOR domain-containing protein [Acidobacteriota bacterium]